MADISERQKTEREVNIAHKMTKAMDHMRATGTLVGYSSTEAFVNELRKHIRVIKVCDKDHLANCWPTRTIVDGNGNEIDISTVKTGKQLNLTTTTNNVGLILADGAVLILNYDPTVPGYDVGDRITTFSKELPINKYKTKVFNAYSSDVTNSIDYITDVNGSGKPNKEQSRTSGKYFDVRSFKDASFTLCSDGPAGCIHYFRTTPPAVNCQTESPDYAGDKYCGTMPSGEAHDRWAGAQKACDELGMRLPSMSELTSIWRKRNQYPEIRNVNGFFWASEETTFWDEIKSWILEFDNDTYNNYVSSRFYSRKVICIE